MTPEEMDKLFAEHCAAENIGDVEAIMATLTDDVEHDVIGDPLGALRDRAAIAQRYRELFDAIREDTFESLRRYHGGDFFVDESLFTGRATGTFLGIPGENRPIQFRVLHVCEFRDGKMSRESVWMDVAAVMQQLAAPAA